MSERPFRADPAIARRIARAMEAVGPAFTERVVAELGPGHVLPAAAVDGLVADFGLAGARDAALLALPAATRLARPPISGFFVGAVGIEAGTGDLILGANLEFPGLDLGSTIHGEGFVATRIFQRDAALAVLATGEARPCAHCRQCLSEYAWSPDLEFIDPLGHTLSLAQLYPWPFVPGVLGEPGIVPGAVPWPDLALDASGLERDLADALLLAGRRAHAPYGRCPAAVVLRLHDGRLIAGSVIESVSFNPTISPLQSALIGLHADGAGSADIASATLAVVRGGDVDPTAATRALLAAVTSSATLTVVTWT
jgi:cytidine deaminase